MPVLPVCCVFIFIRPEPTQEHFKGGGPLCAFLRWHYPDQVRRVSLTRNNIPGPLAKREFSTSARRPARKRAAPPRCRLACAARAIAPLDLSFGPWAPTICASNTLQG